MRYSFRPAAIRQGVRRLHPIMAAPETVTGTNYGRRRGKQTRKTGNMTASYAVEATFHPLPGSCGMIRERRLFGREPE